MNYIALSLTSEEMERLEAALVNLEAIDEDNGFEDEARKTRELINRIRSGEAVIGTEQA